MTSTEQLKLDVEGYAVTFAELASGIWDGEQYEDSYDAVAAYFEDMLDVEFIISGRGEYRGAIILLACGGPTITFDTRTGVIEGFWGWGADAYRYKIDSSDQYAIDDYFAEKWELVRGC